MQIFSTLAVIFVFAFSLLQCNNTTAEIAKDNPNAPAEATADDAPRISLADAKKAFDEGTVIFIDTRAEASFKQEHIKGAINISADTFEAKYKEIPTGKKIIAYCS